MKKSDARRGSARRTVTFDAGRNEVALIDQRLLPHQLEILRLPNYRKTAQAITNMTVRGAGAIGATAAFGLAQGAMVFRGRQVPAFVRHVKAVFAVLANARLTAVDPVNAMRFVQGRMAAGTVQERQAAAVAAAQQFADENVAECEAIGRHGSGLIRPGMRILTHCNAGALAFVDVGTATAPLYAAHAAGRRFQVFCTETRPRGQGAALTAWELAQRGIAHHIIADSAVAHFMQCGEIDCVITGSDRVLARTGEAANKIGTYGLAVLARRHRIPFYIAIPRSTIDWHMRSGAAIPIEERDEAEVLGAWGVDARGVRTHVRTANPGSRARNPAFDVTPAALITAFITPVGLLGPRQLLRHRKALELPFH